MCLVFGVGSLYTLVDFVVSPLKESDTAKITPVNNGDGGKDTKNYIPLLGNGKNIEGEEGDQCEQIPFMVQNLSTRDRQRTINILKPLIDPLLSFPGL